MSTQAIERFLRPPNEGGAYTDERLAALLAHAEDGKLAFNSCCCLLGVTNALHALRGSRSYGKRAPLDEYVNHHLAVRSRVAGAKDAENEFSELAATDLEEGDAERRAKLIPLIEAEIARRDALKTQATCESRDSVRSLEMAGVLTK